MDHGKEIRAICAIAVQQADLGHRDGNHERVVLFAGVSQVVHDERLNALSLLDSQSYVERVVWFGCFASNKPPDSSATGLNTLIKSGGALSDMGFQSAPDRHSHRAISRDLAAADNATTIEVTPVHCDEICHLRNSQIEQCERELAARSLSLDDNEWTVVA
ncbi:glycoside hydrolase family 128 protein [Laccaria amethystina LaAM-08-1]|uniref:Glycoside hydrolase family 128 protein n=1 Tax=Laccaria amethystina LaAM-08-1 TaxID=1095629 RepID=A0A0C9WTW2_9AGAR|nr:glycoside hydrolase family 128 protein [Laccaria amethystina LaAM-08-1]